MKNQTVATYNAAVVKTVDVIGWVLTMIICVGMLVFAANVMANADQQDKSEDKSLSTPLTGLNLSDTIIDGNEG